MEAAWGFSLCCCGGGGVVGESVVGGRWGSRRVRFVWAYRGEVRRECVVDTMYCVR